MDNFGISAVRWNAGHTEIAECMVHRLTRTGDHYACAESQTMPCTEVAGLIGHDYQVWVMKAQEPQPADFAELVQVQGDESERLFSSPRNSLYDLPEF